MSNTESRIPEFTVRFRKMVNKLAENLESRSKVADYLNISIPTLNFWYNGKRIPDAESLIQLSKKFNVSVDYLLGLNESPAVSEDIKQVVVTTGLSETAIDNIRLHSLMSGIDSDLSLVLNNGIFYSIVNSLDDLRYAYNRCVDSINIIQEYEKTHPQKKQYGITLDELAENEELGEAVDTLSEWFPPLRMQLFELTEQWTRFIESEFPNQDLIADGKELYQKYVKRGIENGKH